MGQPQTEPIKTSVDLLLRDVSIEQLFVIGKSRGFACALYRLPNQHTKHLLIDTSSGKNLNHLHLDEMGKGFIFHPFTTEQHQVKFIQKDLHFTEDTITGKTKLAYTTLTDDELAGLLGSKHDIKASIFHETSIRVNGLDDKDEFIHLVNKALDFLKNDAFQKVVVARNKIIELPEQFDVSEMFLSLVDQYPNAFVYLTHLPDTGSWLGATPETLINIDKNRKFQTVALAATQSYRDDMDLEDTSWSPKDIEEQAMVCRYIVNCFKKIRLREFDEIGPRTYLSGNLVHLKTDYKVDIDEVDFPQLGQQMLELLHPTSAVCGMPKEPSKQFIMENEGFDRSYFSGFLGPVHVGKETNIFVNLRCMKLLPKQAILYAGAGIIANSIPEKEWKETEIKMQTLLKVFGKLYG